MGRKWTLYLGYLRFKLPSSQVCHVEQITNRWVVNGPYILGTPALNSCGSKGTMFGQLCDLVKERGSI